MARSAVFLFMTLIELVKIQIIRSQYGLGLFSNKWLIWSLLLTFGLALSIVYIPGLNSLFDLQPLNTEVRKEIQDSFNQLNVQSENKAFEVIDTSMLREDIDIHQMYQEMVWASDGYLHKAFMQGDINADKLKSDFEKLIVMWEKVYQK